MQLCIQKLKKCLKWLGYSILDDYAFFCSLKLEK